MSGDDVVAALAAALTADQLTSGIAGALSRRDVEAVPYYLRALAVVDPAQADLVLKTITVGMAIADERVAS